MSWLSWTEAGGQNGEGRISPRDLGPGGGLVQDHFRDLEVICSGIPHQEGELLELAPSGKASWRRSGPEV